MKEIVEPLVIEMPFKLDSRIGMNSGLSHWKKRELSNGVRDICTTLASTQISFGNLDPLVSKLIVEKNWPLVIWCERHYTGRGKGMDRDNLVSCFKHHIDGILIAMGFVSIGYNKDFLEIVTPLDDEDHLMPQYAQYKNAPVNKLVFTIMPQEQWERKELTRLQEKYPAPKEEILVEVEESIGTPNERNLDLQTTWV